MTKQTTIPATSMTYRPRNYFWRYDVEAELMTGVQGTFRRKFMPKALDSGNLDKLPPSTMESALDEASRQMTGRIHPLSMGGEYLPKMKREEVEITRISIQCTTGDVVCLHARPVGHRIAYQLADEYEGNTLDGPSTRTSMRPLTIGAMIEFFLASWNLLTCLNCNYDNDLKGKLTFFSAESGYYSYFDHAPREQVIQHGQKLAKELAC